MGTIAESRAKVMKILTDAMDLNVNVGKDDKLMVRFDDSSTAVFFNFSEQTFDGKAPTQTFVHITAPMLRDIPASEELYKWVAVNGTGFRIGCVEAFENEDKTVFLHYKYVLLADFLDEDELSTAMWTVLFTADNLDDELQKQFGGKRFVDEN
ncbi:MAG: hypothetical protein RL254_1109 [Planctomycetota bacterium]|jgi:hypothetical protein